MDYKRKSNQQVGGSQASEDRRTVVLDRGQYFRLLMRRGRKTAKVAMARRLAIHLYWMWREERDWKRSVRTQESSDQAMVCSRTPSN